MHLAGLRSPAEKGLLRQGLGDRNVVAACGAALAAKSTLNRLETFGVGTLENQEYKKIDYLEKAVDELLVDAFLDSHRRDPGNEAPPDLQWTIGDAEYLVAKGENPRFVVTNLPRLYFSCPAYLPMASHVGEGSSGRSSPRPGAAPSA